MENVKSEGCMVGRPAFVILSFSEVSLSMRFFGRFTPSE